MQTGTDPTDKQHQIPSVWTQPLQQQKFYDEGESNREIIIQLNAYGFLGHRYRCGSLPNTRHIYNNVSSLLVNFS